MQMKRLSSSGSFDHRDQKLWTMLTLLPSLAAKHLNRWKVLPSRWNHRGYSFCSEQMTRGWENPCRGSWMHIYPMNHRIHIPESTSSIHHYISCTSAHCTWLKRGGRDCNSQNWHSLVLLHAKVFGWYAFANFNRLFHSVSGTESSRGWGLQPQEPYSLLLINPFLIISPVHTVCFSLLLSRSVILQGCLLLSKEAKESCPRSHCSFQSLRNLFMKYHLASYPSSAAHEGTP